MSATVAERHGAASPRTDRLPRAFTFGEFARGALIAWLGFAPFVVLAYLLVGLFLDREASFYGIAIALFGFPITAIATVAGSPLAYLLGMRLRRRRRDLTHVVAFALYGGLWGFAVLFVMYWGDVFSDQETRFTVISCTIATSAAVVTGWWATSRLALRKDRSAMDPPIHIGSLFEPETATETKTEA
ncbi:MAG: hypothetical protein FWD85_08850 [Microbacteriaceae bacterium]|nr:hypothetical protein [Microbacteriaceae bacterium]MCL2795398.1 hypothetical protein [Microbacteriaceae bacterium]